MRMNIPLISEAEFLAETTKRHEQCWAYLPAEQRDKLVAFAVPRAMETFRNILLALDGPRDKERTVIERYIYGAFVDPLTVAETHISVKLWWLFQHAIDEGARAERERIRQGLRADVMRAIGPTAAELVVEDIQSEVDE